jgi:hypothetical protein
VRVHAFSVPVETLSTLEGRAWSLIACPYGLWVAWNYVRRVSLFQLPGRGRHGSIHCRSLSSATDE